MTKQSLVSIGAVVVAVHIVGAVAMLQGCGTVTEPPLSDPDTLVMPGDQPDPQLVATIDPGARAGSTTPLVVPNARTWPDTVTSVYVIRRGDTLSGVAQRFGLTVNEILAFNRGIPNKNSIRVGQRIVLPGKHDVGAAAPTTTHRVSAPPTVPANIAVDGEYVVKSGDCLSTIASRLGTSTKDLRAANGLKTDMIYVGQKLQIPANAKTPMGQTSGSPGTTTGELPPPDVTADVPRVMPDETLPKPDPVDTVPQPVDDGSAGIGVTPPDGSEDTEPEPVAEDGKGYEIHIVEAGEDLPAVALWWGVTPEALRKLNNLKDSKLTVGQRLKIPMPE